MQALNMQLQLAETLGSGQIFRYLPERNGFRVLHGGNISYLEQTGTALLYEGAPRAALSEFFRADDDYQLITRTLTKDSIVKDALSKYDGLRLLRQDPWECTISFICSSATNIPRIKRDLNNISKFFGEEKEGFYLFPKIGEIDNLQKLRVCGTGFRAKYVYAVNGIVTRSFFQHLKNKKYEDAKAELMTLPGVGPKIADCILLFSCDHLTAFPIDTWIEKVLREQYGRTEKSYEKLSCWTRFYFGEYAGYAQQFLYHWRRNVKHKTLMSCP